MNRPLNKNSVLMHIDTTPYIDFTLFRDFPFLVSGFSTRLGGVSKGIFSSMNLGFNRGDSEENVRENYHRICKSIGICENDLVCNDQVHKTGIRIATEKDRGMGYNRVRTFSETDAQITNVPNVPLVVYGADCVPLFFVDPVKKAIAVAHAGWRGTAGKIASKTVQKLTEVYGCHPGDICVVIGPSICSDCYEVGEEVASQFLQLSGQNAAVVRPSKTEGKYLLNLWEANKIVLFESGIKEEHISVSGLCTMCRQDLFFSHRATLGKRGSQAGFLMLKEDNTENENK